MTVRHRSIVFAALVVVAVVVVVPSIALANYAVHGSYTMATDDCAGCHRAHTATSPITWQAADLEQQSALLISTATSIEEFCYTCHGSGMQGADTNVVDGFFEADDGTDNDDTYNTYGEPLNGGGFDPAVFPTQHYPAPTLWVAYGGGNDGQDGIISTGGEQVEISCAACHDTHGTSNYRLLKDQVVGALPTGGTGPVTVGGYLNDDPVNPTPDPYVISTEVGYPGGGFRKHEDGAAQVAGYYPDYTDPRYAIAPNADVTKGISAWCAACHTQYNTAGSIDTSITTDGSPTVPGSYASELYDANDGYGLVQRHRHPVNVALSEFAGPTPLLLADALGNRMLPLGNAAEADALTNELADWIDCLSCHVAHGSSAVMTGYANVADTRDPLPDSGTGQVPPDDGNALLRGDNRFVCEACHNK